MDKEVLKNPQDVLKSVASLQDDNAKLKKQLEQLVKEKIEGLKNTLVSDFQEINGINFLAKQVDLSMSSTKDLAQAIGTSKPNAFVFLASVEDNAPNIHCYISKELVAEKGLNAGNVIRELGKLIDGNGGGQPFFASGKGKNVGGIKEALEKVAEYVKQKKQKDSKLFKNLQRDKFFVGFFIYQQQIKQKNEKTSFPFYFFNNYSEFMFK